MPAYEGKETPEQVWHIVDYLRSMPASAGAPQS
jgi:hypothetical protein